MKNVIITGASSGIGAALAVRHGRAGDRVALLARRGALLDELASLVRQAGGEALVVCGDVGEVGMARSAAEAMLEKWGSIDLAYANAGVSISTYPHRFVLEEVEQVFRTNFHGMLHLFDAVIPSMIEQNRGQFAGIASLAGFRGLPTAAAYSASKAAMQAFLEAVRGDLRSRGVTVTTVNPGFIRTAMTEDRKFRMPFLMELDEAVELIYRRVARGDRQIDFPLPMALGVRVMRLLPNALYDRITRRRQPDR